MYCLMNITMDALTSSSDISAHYYSSRYSTSLVWAQTAFSTCSFPPRPAQLFYN